MATTRKHRAPDATKIASIGCPVERAAVISRFARKVSFLPSTLAALRVAALREAQAAGCSMVTLADALRVTPPRISQLLAEQPTDPDGEVAA